MQIPRVVRPHSEAVPNVSNLTTRVNQQIISIEVFLIFFGSLLSTSIRFQQSLEVSLTQYPGTPKVFIYPLIWFYCLQITHSWDRSIIQMSNDFYLRILKASGLGLLIFSTFAYLVKYPIPRTWVLINTIVITSFLLIFRFTVRNLILRNSFRPQELKYILVCPKKEQIEAEREFISVFGFTPMFVRIDPPKESYSQIWLSKFLLVLSHEKPYGILINVGAIQDAALLRQLADLKREQVIDFLLATRLGAISNRFERLESPTVVRVRESQVVSGGSVLKRLLDIFAATFFLILFLPVFLIIPILVKSTSKGPVFYIDKRIGIKGKTFSFPKFRTMYEGTDKERLSILGRPDAEMSQRYRGDSRITPLGRVLRRWSIDEIPQFWCVLIGTMSMVGPRPVLQEELSQIPDAYQIRFIAKPGLTGLWQVTGRKEVPWNDRMVRDISYIDNWSLSQDLVLIMKTIGAIIRGTGSY